MLNKKTINKDGFEIPLVNGCLEERKGTNIYCIVLWWYEKGESKRSRQSISTNLSTKGRNKTKANLLLRQAIESKEASLLEIEKSKTRPDDMLFGDFMKYWLSIVECSLQRRTYLDYKKKIYNQIAPYFDEKGVTVRTLTVNMIQNFYKFKLQTVKGNTVRRYHANIHKALKYACKINMISDNPAQYVELPKMTKPRIQYCEMDELQKILDLSKGTFYEMPVILAVFYGLRRSEALAVRWSRINFRNKTVSIEEKVSEISGISDNKKAVLEFSPDMKTDASLRVMPLLPEVEQALLNLKIRIKKNKAFYGNSYDMQYDDYVCVQENGKLMRPDYLTEHFPRFIQPLNLQKRITYHGLRHSCATMLLSLGFDLKDIQEWLGHGSIKITGDFYAHLSIKRKLKMGDKINEKLRAS